MTATTDLAVPCSPPADVLRAAVAWLFEVEQPDDAVLQHHGLWVGRDERFAFEAVPAGAGGAPLVVVDVALVEWTGHGPEHRPKNPITQDEHDAMIAALSPLVAVRDTWNGPGAITGSYALAGRAHPSLLAAVERYHRGCPTHRSVFCGRQELCGWYADGRARIIAPAVLRG